MKKKLNTKNNFKKQKIIISLFVIFIFLFFISSTLILSNRKYFYIEGISKTMISKINSFIIKNTYDVKKGIGENNYLSKIEEIEKENNELKKIIDLKSSNTNYIPEVVINRNNYYWNKKLEITNSNKNIKINMPVINSYGLIGFISKTSKNVSEVNLLTNINKRNLISVLIKTSSGEIIGVLKDYDEKNNLFKVTDIIEKNEVNKGDKVILSGYQNNYKGILVGEVFSQEVSDYGLTKTIFVKSSVNFDDIMYVLVVGEK